MKCPFCRKDNDKVNDTRLIEDGFSIRRRRLCMACNRRFTTYERIEEVSLKIVKKDRTRETFERDKIKRGVARACWKRPVSDAQIEELVLAVESDVYDQSEYEISSRVLGEIVMTNLANLDQVAYVRFASVYREFTDASDFVDELEPILRRSKK